MTDYSYHPGIRAHRAALAREAEENGTLDQYPDLKEFYLQYKEEERLVQEARERDPEYVAARKRQEEEVAARAARLAKFEEEQPVLAQAIKKLQSEHWFQEAASFDGGDVLRDRAILALAQKLMRNRFGTVERCLREFFIGSEPDQHAWTQMLVDGAPRPADFQELSSSWTVDYHEVLASVCQPTTVTARKKFGRE